MGYFNFYLIKKIIKKLFNFKILFAFILLLFIYFIKCNVFALTATEDIYNEIINYQKIHQDNFVLYCLKPYLGNTLMWQNELKPIFDNMTANGFDINISEDNRNGARYFDVKLYNANNSNWQSGSPYDKNYSSQLNATTIPIKFVKFTNTSRYLFSYYPSTNSGSTTISSLANFELAQCVILYKSDLLINFYQLINGYTNDYTNILNSINNYLDSIDDVNSDILSQLNSISLALSTISSNTSTNYSQQISQISGKIDDILTDNDTIISQNASMIQEQQEINDNLEDVNDNLQNINDTLTDDAIESSASDLPSTNVQDPTQNGIDNIFQSIYNAFCVGEAQDIVFPIPFTNKSITLSPYYVRDMLNNNNAGWIYTLIQAFWGYLIGRYIVKDISHKITKIKSGDIENIENNNIKEEML